MIELRWKLDQEHPEELKDNAPLDAYTLQYRLMQYVNANIKWTEWKDVPFVSEDK